MKQTRVDLVFTKECKISPCLVSRSIPNIFLDTQLPYLPVRCIKEVPGPPHLIWLPRVHFAFNPQLTY